MKKEGEKLHKRMLNLLTNLLVLLVDPKKNGWKMKNTPTTITQNNKEMGNELVKNRFLIRCLSIFFLKSFLKMIRMIKIGNNATTS